MERLFRTLKFLIPLAGCITLQSLGAAEASAATPEVSSDLAKSIFNKLQVPEGLDPARVALGERLFHDSGLSANGKVSCASCHMLDQGGDDNVSRSTGISGKPTAFNSPSVYNLVGHVAYFWDGRAESLEAQIDGPIHHPDKMDSDWPSIIKWLRSDADYMQSFRESYGDGPSEKTAKDAIVQFEKSLITPDSPFDRFLASDETALSNDARKGLAKFVDLGCSACHQGELIGATSFQKFGVFAAVDDEADEMGRVKVPSLRNVALTAPYFHDGREPDLEGAVKTMAKVQLGAILEQKEVQMLAAFLRALTSDRLGRKHLAIGKTGDQ